MARKYPFTRTLFTQTADCLVFDKETAEPMNISVTLPNPIAEPAKLEKAVARLVNKDNIKLIEVVNTVVEEQLYGITAEDFMAHAVKLDPKTRKPINDKE